MGSNWRGYHACTSLVWRQMWADWIVEIWTSVKDYLPEIISAGEAWPLVQRWLQVKRQLWGDLAGPATGAPSPHFPHFPTSQSHSSSSLTCRKPSLSLGRVKLQQRMFARHSLFSFRFETIHRRKILEDMKTRKSRGEYFVPTDPDRVPHLSEQVEIS